MTDVSAVADQPVVSRLPKPRTGPSKAKPARKHRATNTKRFTNQITNVNVSNEIADGLERAALAHAHLAFSFSDLIRVMLSEWLIAKGFMRAHGATNGNGNDHV